jgi:hypothetical protein
VKHRVNLPSRTELKRRRDLLKYGFPTRSSKKTSWVYFELLVSYKLVLITEPLRLHGCSGIATSLWRRLKHKTLTLSYFRETDGIMDIGTSTNVYETLLILLFIWCRLEIYVVLIIQLSILSTANPIRGIHIFQNLNLSSTVSWCSYGRWRHV